MHTINQARTTISTNVNKMDGCRQHTTTNTPHTLQQWLTFMSNKLDLSYLCRIK
jgi:hypothetical protein